ncbi:MAG TPA: DegV family protein [Clostridiales bacterium]|nr:DegV family protein [Clostridiales bacterium]
MKIVISAESTIDLPKELLDKYNIKTTPFTINLGDELIEDHFGVSKEIFEFVDKSKKLPKTSAVSPDQFQTHFENLKKDYDAIVHVSLSSLISSAYNNACMVAKEMENVYVVDSKSLSTGIALLAIKGKDLIDEGKDAKEIFETLQALTPKVEASFVLERLNYLHKGGRCSALALLGANILKIKPQIILSDGRMIVGKKYMGNMTKVVDKYIDDLLDSNPNPILEHVFITHSSPMPEAEKILTEKLENRGFKYIHNTLAGGTISSHCGPNCIGVLFLNK